MCLAIQTVLLLCCTGRTTDIVIDSDGVLHTVPICEAYALPHAMWLVVISQKSMKIFIKRGYSITASAEREFVPGVMEKNCATLVLIATQGSNRQGQDLVFPD